MTKTNIPLKINNHNPRYITGFSVSLIIALASLGVAISFIWPQSWNSLLCGLMLNIISSLIGVIVGALIALFIVERYLEQRRREAAEREALQEKQYNEQWQAYIDGGLSTVAYLIALTSLYVSQGREKFIELLKIDNEASKIPVTIEEFVISIKKDLEKASLNEKNTDKGFGAEDAARLAKSFSECEPVEISYDVDGLISLINFLDALHQVLVQNIFMFQPFMIKRVGLGLTLKKLDMRLVDVIDHMEHMMMHAKEDHTLDSIQISGRKYCLMGFEACMVIQLIWSYVQNNNDMKVVSGN